LSKVIKIKMQ